MSRRRLKPSAAFLLARIGCLICVCGFWLPESNAQRLDVDLPAVRSAFQESLEESKLSDTFELQRLRWGARADDVSAQWLKLEMRLVVDTTNQDRADAFFRELLQSYRGVAGIRLPEKLFYRFAHLSGVSRKDAVIYISVLTRNYAVLWDGDKDEITVAENADRLIRRSAIVDSTPVVPVNRNTDAAIKTPLTSATAGRIEQILEEFFKGENRKARLEVPQFKSQPLEPNYIGLEVMGIKKVVLRDEYWERLQISIELRREENGLRATCYIDGYYAAGLGSRVPEKYSAMETVSKNVPDLERFTEAMLALIQKGLATPAR